MSTFMVASMPRCSMPRCTPRCTTAATARRNTAWNAVFYAADTLLHGLPDGTEAVTEQFDDLLASPTRKTAQPRETKV